MSLMGLLLKNIFGKELQKAAKKALDYQVADFQLKLLINRNFSIQPKLKSFFDNFS